MKPFFSIITVTKNSENKIDKTVKSVLSQSFKDLEYIVIDGNSTDETFKKVQKYKDKKIKIFCRDDKNFYDGLNFAIKKAKGKYISVLNAGDFYYSNFILRKIHKNILKFRNYDFYFSNLLFVNQKNKVKRKWLFKNFYNNLKDAFKIAHPTIFFSKKIAKNFKYNTKYYISADLDLILRIIKRKVSYRHLNFLSVVMETGGMSSFQGKFLKKIYEDLKINKKYFKHYFLNFFIQKILKVETFLFKEKF